MAKTRTKRSDENSNAALVGRVVKPRVQDFNQCFNVDISPSRVRQILVAAASGDPRQQEELFNDALEKDGDLFNAKRTRLMAVTGLEWEVVSAAKANRPGKIDEKLADDAADYCREVLAGIQGFDEGLRHLIEAVARGVAVLEFGWDSIEGSRRPVECWPVMGTQLRTDSRDPGRLRCVIGENDWVGTPIDEFIPGKFAVHCPNSIGGSHFRGALLRASMVGHLIKRIGQKGWAMGVEIFGLPMTVAKVDPSLPPQVKDDITSLCMNMGIARGGVFPTGADIELHEFNNPGAWPHERLIAFVDAGYAKLWLGQTLTTQVGETGGANAAAQVHDEVRDDIRDDDVQQEKATITGQLLRPLVLAKFGERVLPVLPEFRRIVEDVRDTEVDLRVLSGAVNDLGLEVPIRFAVEQLGIPVRQKDAALDEPIPGRRASLSALSPFDPSTQPGRTLRVLAGEARVRRAVPVSRTTAWMLAAVTAFGLHVGNVMGSIATFIEKRRDLETALVELPTAFESLPIDDGVELERQYLLTARLVGMADALERMLDGRDMADNGINFARIPFEKAIESLRDRVGLTPEEFEALDAEARSRAWRVAGVSNMDLLATVHKELVASIAAGETARDFRLRVRDQMADRDGWSGENPWHANIVHTQNFFMAHAAGRYGEYQDAGITHWRFVYTGEGCPICEPFSDKVFPLSDRKAFPPLHFNCRCEDEPVFEGEVADSAVVNFEDIHAPDLAAEQDKPSGFKWDPKAYANLGPLNLRDFPLELQPMFEAFAKRHGWEIES